MAKQIIRSLKNVDINVQKLKTEHLLTKMEYSLMMHKKRGIINSTTKYNLYMTYKP